MSKRISNATNNAKEDGMFSQTLLRLVSLKTSRNTQVINFCFSATSAIQSVCTATSGILYPHELPMKSLRC